MGTFLFTSQPAMGHLNSLITMARHLREQSHTPVFVCHGPKTMEDAVVKNGFQAVRMRPVPCALCPAPYAPCLSPCAFSPASRLSPHIPHLTYQPPLS